MSGWKFFLVTFGCKVNQYETQSLREAWSTQGGEECEDPAGADVICINSCAITAKGERDARNAVFRLRREAPAARIILTGCATRLFARYVPRRGAIWAVPDVLVPQGKKDTLLRGPWADFSGDAAKADFPPFRISSFKRARPVLKVQDGCSHRCTYCIVPLTRGPHRSRPVADIVAEAGRLLAAGHAEIMISGINLSQYGRDAHTGDFWHLLQTLDTALAPEFAGRARLRISSLEPGQLNPRGLDVLRSCAMLCPHVHISLQHASQAVLKRMGRGHYTADMLEQAVEGLSRHWPVMGLSADIIAGFPGETEEDLRLLLDLVERLPLTDAHVFPYSRRPGTAADSFDQHIPHALKLERAQRIRAAVQRKHQDFLQKQLSLPLMHLALDSSSRGLRHKGGGQALRGVNEYYAACTVPAESAAGLSPDFSGLLRVSPTGCDHKGLTVRPTAAHTRQTPA